MEFHENRGDSPFKTSPFRLIYQLPYRWWKTWQLRAHARKVLSNLNDAQLKDIGLTSEDVKRYK